MPAQFENLEFLNANSLRNYPIKEGMSCIDGTGVFTIPNDFIVDLQLAATYDPTRSFFISQISNFEDSITIEITDSLSTLAGSFTITTSGFTQYSEFYFVPTSSYVGATGVIVINGFNGISQQPNGNFFFTSSTAILEARAIIPALQGINRLIFTNADGSNFSLTGDVQFIARTNLRFSNPTGNQVMLDAGENLGLNTTCANQLPCIETINGIPPDSSGNFTLDFSECAELTAIPANTGLMLSDVCCKPCTGCDDIQTLTNRLTTVESQLLTLRDYYTTLTTFFTNFQTTVNYTCNCPP